MLSAPTTSCLQLLLIHLSGYTRVECVCMHIFQWDNNKQCDWLIYVMQELRFCWGETDAPQHKLDNLLWHCLTQHGLEFKPWTKRINSWNRPPPCCAHMIPEMRERFPESFVNDWGANWAKHSLHQQNTGGTFWTSLSKRVTQCFLFPPFVRQLLLLWRLDGGRIDR